MSNKSLKSIRDIDVSGGRVLVRGDLDVEDGENPRVNSVKEVVRWLGGQGASKIKVMGHRETAFAICELLRREYPDVEFDDRLRDDPGERANSEEFAGRLAEGWDIYINEAFATSHRKHASIDALPRWMKRQGKEVCIGLRFEKEIRTLEGVLNNAPSDPPLNLRGGRYGGDIKRVLVIGGVKVEDKERCARVLGGKGWMVLRGGLLPGASLRLDGMDISDEAIEKYVAEIGKAEVILAAGVMGKYEDPGAVKGTRAILEAIANNARAYKVAGGGDIEMAISTYGLTDKFDWISVGGGAMLEYLATGTLPGIEAVVG